MADPLDAAALAERVLLQCPDRGEGCSRPECRLARALLAERKAREDMERQLAEADAVINYDTARGWPRYGLEPPILKAGEDVPARSAAMKRHASRSHPSDDRGTT